MTEKIYCPICRKEHDFTEGICVLCGYDLNKYKQEVEKEDLPAKPNWLLSPLLIISFPLVFMFIMKRMDTANRIDLSEEAPIVFAFLFMICAAISYFVLRSGRKKKELYELAQKDPFAAKCIVYQKRKEEEHIQAIMNTSEVAIIQREKEAAIFSQRPDAPEWEIRYSTHPCPGCGHYKVRYSNWDDKRISVAFWVAASDKLGKNYKCDHCGRMW